MSVGVAGGQYAPVDEAQLVDSLDGQDDLGDVEAGNVFGEDLVLDEHGHQVSTGKELHEHVEEVRVLEGCEELDDPRAVGLGQDVSLGAHVSELVLLEHLGLDQRLHGIDLAVRLLLHELDLTESALADDLDRGVVFGFVLGPQETQVRALSPPSR